MAGHRLLVTVPQPRRDELFSPEALAHARQLGEVILNEDGHNWSEQELAAHLPGVDAIVASWGLAKLTPEVLAAADRLRIVGYGAGSVKGFATDALFERGIALSHAASRIADSVAEFTLLMAMLGLRQPHTWDRQMKTGVAWPKSDGPPTWEITGAKVGLLGMGYVGRRSAGLFQGVGAEVWAFDPYLSLERARELEVHKAELSEVLAKCKVICVHLPVTEETHHMLGECELALIQDGAVFVNNARAWVVDQDAMVAELATGRFWAALDVFDPEPLPAEHPLRDMDNVLLTPHIAGRTVDSYGSLMAEMVNEVDRFFKGEPLRYQVTRDMMATMA